MRLGASMRYHTALVLAGAATSAALAADRLVPLEVKLEVEGRFAVGSPWSLKVGSDRVARLAVDSFPKPKQRVFRVSNSQVELFRQALVRERLFALGDEYGDPVPDGSVRTLTVRHGAQTKTVRLRFLRDSDPRKSEVKRVLRVWYVAQGWFDEPAAVDLRRYDRRLLASGTDFRDEQGRSSLDYAVREKRADIIRLRGGRAGLTGNGFRPR
jgi:hypothetical protein